MFTDTVKLSSKSSYVSINKDIPVGYFFTNLGDDDSWGLKGTWNAERTVKTVTSATSGFSFSAFDADIVFLNYDKFDGLTCLKFSDGRNVNIPQNFKVTIDKIPLYFEIYKGSYDPSDPCYRKDGYYYFLHFNPFPLTTNFVLDKTNFINNNSIKNANGTYNFTFKFNYNGKDYSFKKTLVISF